MSQVKLVCDHLLQTSLVIFSMWINKTRLNSDYIFIESHLFIVHWCSEQILCYWEIWLQRILFFKCIRAVIAPSVMHMANISCNKNCFCSSDWKYPYRMGSNGHFTNGCHGRRLIKMLNSHTVPTQIPRSAHTKNCHLIPSRERQSKKLWQWNTRHIVRL